MWIRVGGGQAMWIIIKFYNIIIKSANVDKVYRKKYQWEKVPSGVWYFFLRKKYHIGTFSYWYFFYK